MRIVECLDKYLVNMIMYMITQGHLSQRQNIGDEKIELLYIMTYIYMIHVVVYSKWSQT
jgi:hypothetical protein